MHIGKQRLQAHAPHASQVVVQCVTSVSEREKCLKQCMKHLERESAHVGLPETVLKIMRETRRDAVKAT